MIDLIIIQGEKRGREEEEEEEKKNKIATFFWNIFFGSFLDPVAVCARLMNSKRKKEKKGV